MDLNDTLRDRVRGCIHYNISFGLTQRGITLYASTIDALVALTWRIVQAVLTKHLTLQSEARILALASRVATNLVDMYANTYERHLNEH